MKTVYCKDEKVVLDFTLEYFKKLQESPEKYMPLCTFCSTERSYILLAYSPQGESRTALFGLCRKCCPTPEECDEEMLKKALDSVKKRLETGESTVHVTPKEWTN